MHNLSLTSSARRDARNAVLAAAFVCLLGLAAGAAYADKPKPSDDPIVVPQSAVEVDQISLVGSNRKWTPLNHRMILASVGTKYFLMVFDDACPRLMQRNAIITTRTNDTVLDARTDVIYVDTRVSGSTTSDALVSASEGAGFPCQIDRMYSILDEDAKALREQFKR